MYFCSTLGFTCLQYKSFENIVGKGEIARNEKFLLFPQCFLPVWRIFCIFIKFEIVVCKLYESRTIPPTQTIAPRQFSPLDPDPNPNLNLIQPTLTQPDPNPNPNLPRAGENIRGGGGELSARGRGGGNCPFTKLYLSLSSLLPRNYTAFRTECVRH